MAPIRMPAPMDVVRLTKRTVEATVDALIVHFNSSGGGFNYLPSCKVARPTFSGELSRQAAVNAARSCGSPVGYESNAEVAGLIWDLGHGRNVMCTSLKARPFGIRKDLATIVRPPFYFVESGRVYIFWPQLRRYYALNPEQLGALATIIRMTFVNGDLANADLELFDCSVPPGGSRRQPKVHRFANLPNIGDEAVSQMMQRFADAWDLAMASGRIKPRVHKKQHPNDGQGSLL